MHDTTEGEEAGLWPKVKSFFFKLGSVEALGYARDVMMSPWLFDIYIKGAVREVNASKHVGKKSLNLLNGGILICCCFQVIFHWWLIHRRMNEKT